MEPEWKSYNKSFQIHERDAILNYFDENGYVVVDNVLNEDECNASVDEIWMYLEKRGVSRNATSWENETWPKEICRNGGFMGRFPFFNKMKDLADHDIPCQLRAWENRQNANVYDVFSNVLRNERLWVSIDRYGIMRPTVLNESNQSAVEKPEDAANVESPENQSATVGADQPQGEAEGSEKKVKNQYFKDEWKTKPNWLHWDLSPFHYGTSAAGYLLNKNVPNDALKNDYGGLRVQGLISLVDCTEEVGGFHCVPRFHGDRFFAWAKDNTAYGEQKEIQHRNFVEVPDNDPMRPECTRVAMRKGSLLIWNSQLPHGNFPNSCDRFRFVQYIKMIAVDEPREFIPAIGNSKFKDEADFFPPEFVPTAVGRKLFGIDPW